MKKTTMDKISQGCFDNLVEDMLKTNEGVCFMAKYMNSRVAVSDMEKKVLDVLRDRNFSTSELIGFMQYMKHVIPRSSYLPKEK